MSIVDFAQQQLAEELARYQAAATAPPQEDESSVMDTVSDLTEPVDSVGKAAGITEPAIEAIDTTAKAKGIAKSLGRASGVLALPADGMSIYDGVKAVGHGDGTGWYDIFSGGAGVISDVSQILGKNDISDIAGMIQGGLEINKGVYEIATGGNGITALNGVTDILTGVADAVGSAPNEEAALLGKGLGAGLAAGTLAGKLLFGGESDANTFHQADGDYVPSTGFFLTDFALGQGKYADGRFSPDGGFESTGLLDGAKNSVQDTADAIAKRLAEYKTEE